jgi:hypothetical protein
MMISYRYSVLCQKSIKKQSVPCLSVTWALASVQDDYCMHSTIQHAQYHTEPLHDTIVS